MNESQTGRQPSRNVLRQNPVATAIIGTLVAALAIVYFFVPRPGGTTQAEPQVTVTETVTSAPKAPTEPKAKAVENTCDPASWPKKVELRYDNQTWSIGNPTSCTLATKANPGYFTVTAGVRAGKLYVDVALDPKTCLVISGGNAKQFDEHNKTGHPFRNLEAHSTTDRLTVEVGPATPNTMIDTELTFHDSPAATCR